MAKFKFTNITTDTELVAEKVKLISPAYKSIPSDVPDYYNAETAALKDQAVKAVVVRIPLYRVDQFVSVKPGESVEIETDSSAAIAYYRNLVAAYMDAKNPSTDVAAEEVAAAETVAETTDSEVDG